MAGKAGVLREKTLQAVIYFLFHLIIHFLLLDNSILLKCLFTQRTHMLTSLFHKMDGSKRNILKGTVKGNTPAIPHRVGGDHEFS